MNFKTTLVLVLLVAATALYFVFFELDRPASRQRGPQPEPGADGTAIFHEQPLATGQVARVTIERPERRVVLARAADTWRQVEPVQFPLTDHAASQLLDAAAGLHYHELIDAGDGGLSLADAGLEPPRVTLTLKHGDERTTLRLGRRAPGGHGYLMLDEHPEIHLVDDALHELVLEQDVNEWRRRDFEAPPAGATERIVIERRGEATIELFRHEGRWYLDETRTERGSREAIEALAEAVGSARIENFVTDEPDDLSIYGLHEPRLALTLHMPPLEAQEEARQAEAAAEDEHYTLRVGSGTDLEASEYFATWSVQGTDTTRSPVVFTLREDTFESLRRDVSELRDPHLITTRPREVNAIEIERDARPPLHLVREVDRGFGFGDPAPDYRPDYEAVTRMLERLADAEAVDSHADFEPAEEPVMQVRITPRGGAAGEALRLYEAEEEDRYLSVREGESVAYEVEREAIADLFRPRQAFRNRDVLDVDEGRLTQVTLDRADGVTFTFVRDADGDWALEGHKAFDAPALNALLDALSPLRVHEWRSGEPAALEADAAVLTLEIAEGSPRVLRVNPETADASLDGGDAGFEVPAALVEALEAEYRDRLAMPVRQEEIDSVTIGYADDAVTLRRDASGRYVAEDDRSVTQSAAGRLFDTLAGLRIERYEAIDPGELPEATRRLTVRVRGERAHELAIIEHEDADEADPRIVVLDGRAVRLSERDYAALRADVAGESGEGAELDPMVK